MKKNKKKKLTVVALLAMLAIVSATFAWLTATATAKNHLETAQISGDMVEVTEDFEPPTNWKPGETVIKDVKITNKTEDITMLARVHFSEVLKKLQVSNPGNELVTKEVSDPIEEDKTTSIPKHVNVSTNNGAEWVTADPANFAPTSISKENFAAYGLTVKVKTFGSQKTYVIYRTLPADDNGKVYYQEVKTGTPMVEVNGQLLVKDVNFVYYPERTETGADWRNAPIPTKAAMFDFTTDPARPFVKASTDNLIEINLGSVTSGDKPVQGEWFYNEEDGYFYYIDAIAANSVTNPIMKSLKLNGQADNKYSTLHFDLNITVEAIQNFKAALPAIDGWKMNIESGNGKLIYNELLSINAIVEGTE